jgi:predicted RNase H-like HicB family nuclease
MKDLRKKIDITVEITSTGYSAFAHDVPVFSTGKTLEDIKNNLTDALNLYYEDLGYRVSQDNLKISIDLQQFFKYFKVLNAHFLAQRIGMNATLLSQYVRGRKKPSPKQTLKIMKGINKIGKELSEIQLL